MTYIFIFRIIFDSFNLEIILFIIYLILFFVVNFFRLVFEQNTNKNILISDKSIDWIELKDELWFQDNADNFAKIVYNNWNSDNQIFWLVAERWAWKTSFLNLFKNNPTILKDSIYIEFNPWYYENEKDLLEKFLENIISNLKSRNYYLPKLDKNFKTFLKVLDDNSEKLFWLKLWFSNTKTLIDIKNDINESLKSVNKKIIIVIDDLDRIPSNKLKEIFRIVDLCKDFYNTSYILCYDPLNFNSIDDNLVQTLNQKWNEINFIESQKVDNSELVRYMSKIINVYYPLIIDKEKLKEYFLKIFTKENLKIDEDSKNNIKESIEQLFLYDNFNLWWKYYSNIRLIKRIYNLFLIFNNEYWEINYFNTEKWINFANFFKLSILMLNFNDIFIDINNEVELIYIDKNWLNEWDYTFILWFGWISIWWENQEINYKKYLENLTTEKRELLIDLFPINLKDKNIKENYSLRDLNVLNNYLSILKTYWNNSKENFNKLLNDFKNYKIDFENYFINNNSFLLFYLEGTDVKNNSKFNDFIVDKLYYYSENDKIEHSTKYFNFILNYNDFYSYTPDFQFEFSSDIVKVLSSSFRSWNDFKIKVRNYIYWINNEKSFIDTIIDFTKDTLKIEWLLQILMFIRVFHKDNWGYYNQFMELLKTEDLKTVEDLRWEYCNFIFEKLEKNNYFDDVNIFNEMLNFEIKNNTNQLTYWLQNLVWSLGENNKQKFIWYLKQGFEKNINFFLNYFLRYLSSNFSRNFTDLKFDADKIKFDDFYNVFGKDYLKTLLNKKDEVNNNLKIDLNNNFGEKLLYPSNNWELFELFEKSIQN